MDKRPYLGRMKLSQYARLHSITYRTAHRHWRLGLLKGKQLPTGTIVVEDAPLAVGLPAAVNYAVYGRVSSGENKGNLDSQVKRLVAYANAKGYAVCKIVKEIGSGLNDERPKLLALLQDPSVHVIVVEHKDRFSRFGTNFVSALLAQQGRRLEIVNPVSDEREDLMQDFVSLVTSFCACLYGKRRTKRRTEALIQELQVAQA